MGYASRLGRARISSRNPQAAAVCDRCGFVYNHVDLKQQPFWAGAALVTKNVLVCSSCYDAPQQNGRRAVVLPQDPPPIINPRVQDYTAASLDIRQASGYNTVNALTGIPVPDGPMRETQDGSLRTIQQTGAPLGSLNPLPGTDPNAPGDTNPGLPYDNTEVPATGPIIQDTTAVVVLTTNDGLVIVTEGGLPIGIE